MDAFGGLTLYRGDFEKISKFKFHKTNRHCLVGRGIYLTDSKEVADSYRTKGMRITDDYCVSKSDVLFQGETNNKGEALEKAFEKFLSNAWEKAGKRNFAKADKKAVSFFKASVLSKWEDLLANGLINASPIRKPLLLRRGLGLATAKNSYTLAII